MSILATELRGAPGFEDEFSSVTDVGVLERTRDKRVVKWRAGPNFAAALRFLRGDDEPDPVRAAGAEASPGRPAAPVHSLAGTAEARMYQALGFIREARKQA